jgi:hypothetical protein
MASGSPELLELPAEDSDELETELAAGAVHVQLLELPAAAPCRIP